MIEKKKTYKDKMAVITGYISFFAGWILVFADFIYPPFGAVADTTLWILGQSLLYVAALLGISQYAKTEISKIRTHVGMADEDEED